VTSTSNTREVLARLDTVADIYTGNLEPAAVRAGVAAKRDATLVALELTGGKLSHMGARGVRLGSGFEVLNTGRMLVIKLRPAGAWIILESGARPHVIDAHGKRRRAEGHAVHAAKYPHPVRSTPHPGARGKRGITRTFAKMRATVPKAFHDAQVAQMVRVFGG
jgi:hypothetical protein